MQGSIQLSAALGPRYVLRLADTCLVLAQRLAEWCGHAPILEEDIALANIGLDLLGQARALLTRAGQLSDSAETAGPESQARRLDEDALAFLREERDYLNATIVELPIGDFAFTTLRNALVAMFLRLLWQRLQSSNDSELAAIAGKAVKEARYHWDHAADWVVRLGDGTPESRQRMECALRCLWPYTRELFDADEVDEHAAANGLGPRWADVREPWLSEMAAMLGEAGLEVPSESNFRSAGKRGQHSEHMGHMLSEMQYLRRAYPGGVW